MPYPRFTKVIINHFISKDKTISIRNMINLHTIRDDLLLDIKDSKAYKTYYDFATRKTTPKKARKYKKVASPSRKLSIVLEEEPAVKPKKANKPAKKSTTVPTTALLEVTQIKEALKKSKKDSHMLHPSGSGDGVGSQPKVPDESEDKKTCTDEGTGTKPGVHDVSKYQYESENESWGDSEDYDNVNDSDDVSKGDDDKADINEEEETQEDEYIHTPDYYVPTNEETNDENKEFDDEDYNQLYKDVNIRLKVAEHKEVSKGDAEMTDATHESASQEKSYKQVIEDAHSYTAEFKKKAQKEKDRYIALVEKSIKDVINDEVKSQFPQILPKEVSDFATLVIQASLTEFELKKILLDKIQKSKSYRGTLEHRQLYDALIKSYKLDKDIFESYVKTYSLKRDHDDKDQDEDPLAGSYQGLKKRKTRKDAEPPKGSKSKDSTSSSSKGTMSQIDQIEKPPLTFDELMSTHVDFSAYFMNNLKIDNLTQEILKNPEGHEYPFDLSKTVMLIEAQGCQVFPANYFFNNDFGYMKSGSSSRKYMTSTTKTKAAKYENIKGIKDMVLAL
nr:hypothetical protein [Tanacetum cinerariifolium]